MGFISNAERERKLERVNRRNWGRKVFICVTLVLFLAFLTLSVVASFLSEDNKIWAWSAAGFNVNGTYLTPFGWFMFVLVVELQCIAETFPTNLNELINLIELVSNEIEYIKGWRKSDNKRKLI